MQGAHAQTITSAVPGFISYQGRALDANGVALGTSGGALAPVNRTVTFRVWDHPSNVLEAHLIYSEQQTVTISGGEFSVLIGQGTATSGTTFGYSESSKGVPTVQIGDLGVFGGATRYLGVTIEDGTAAVDNEISPRQQLVSSAYSFRSKYAEQLGANGLAALTALDSGNVGIGNTNPPARFTVTGANTSTSSSNPQLLVTDNADPTKRLRIGVDSTGTGSAGTSTGFIQSFREGSGVQNLLLNPNGGSVGIGGAASSNIALSVTGAITATGTITGGSITTAAGSLTTNTGNIGIGTTAPATRFQLDDGLNTGPWASATISRPANGHTGSHMAFIRSGGQIMGVGYAPSVNTFGFGPGASGVAFNPNYLSIDQNNGNVGIGKSNPLAKLDVNGNAYVRGQINLDGSIVMGADSSIYGTNTANVAEPAFWPRASDGTYINYGTSGFFIRNNASTNTMVMLNNGNVGIGTGNPGTKLQIDDGATDAAKYGSLQINRPAEGHTAAHMSFVRVGLVATGLGYGQSSSTFGFGPATTGAFSPSWLGFSTTGNVQIGSNVKIDGQVQIGTGTLVGRLNLGTSLASYRRIGGVSTDGGSATDADRVNSSVSLWADGVVVTNLVDIHSDARIKNVLRPTDSVKDLQTLMAIQITDYQLKDTIANGNAPQKKVIAQQVEQIFPQAVSVRQGIVPDIYKNAQVKDHWVMLATDLKVGERVRLISASGESVEEVLEVRGDAFRSSLKSTVEEIFVYGREVPDFRSVDYDAIAMLNVSATQQLKHEKDAEMQVLRDENAALRRELAAKDRALAAKDESVEARLIALERRMSGEGEAQTVSLKITSAAK
jgi:hypothetical protein